MNYKLIKNYQETWFYEFCPGKYDSKEPKYDSVYISSEAWYLVADCVHRANNNFEGLAITEYTKEKRQIQLLTEELKIRLTEIIEDKDLSKKFGEQIGGMIGAIDDSNEKSQSGLVTIGGFEHESIPDLKKYKTEIVTMFKDLMEWLENLKENELTIIPPFDEFINIILRPE